MNGTAILKQGLSRQATLELDRTYTIHDIVTSDAYRQILALPEAVRAVVDGMTVAEDYIIRAGDVVVFEKQAASKAA